MIKSQTLIQGVISFSRRWSGYLVCKVGNEVLYFKGLVERISPLELLGTYVRVYDADRVIKKGQKGYIVKDYEFLQNELSFSSWHEEVLYFLKKSGRRGVLKQLSQGVFTVDVLYNLYVKGKINFYEFFACVLKSGFIRAGKLVLFAIVKHFAEEFYNLYKGKRNELSLFVRYISSFLSSVGVKVSLDEIEDAVKTNPQVRCVLDNSVDTQKFIVYPKDIAVKKQYVLSRIQAEIKDNTNFYTSLDEALANHKYVALIGGPGTGKTTTVVDYFYREDKYIQCTALLGRAAQRLPNGVTIHKWLGYNGREFTSEDTYCDVLFVDECSMLTWDLLYETLVRPHGKIVFVGDPEQLPPVHGESVFDNILRFLPTVVLKKVHRGQMYVKHERFFTPTSVYERLSSLIFKFLEKKVNWQVLSPIYDGALGVDAVNEFIHREFYQPGIIKERVFVNSNFYDYYGRLLVTNGATGYLLKRKGDTVTVELDSGEVLDLPLKSVNLGYCMSVYKAQGSEWDVVVLLIPKNFRKTKEFVKTATTRGKIVTYVLEEV